MVRIKDVAREAGVAPSTVSLVMNKKTNRVEYKFERINE